MSDLSNSAESIFCRAVELKPAERQAFLNQACGGDARLRDQVARLLLKHARAGDFLESPVADLATWIDPAIEKSGTRIGNYTLIEQIGEGGFGIVFRAQQLEPVQREVAVKIIKPGMDTSEVVARFEAERQALARMEHPCIAHAIDAGSTESGRPYFVMELVHGIPITEFCDQHKLSTAERLALFVDVCRGIQHAHHKGVIHRDIKPSNVLVSNDTDRPIPKIIDFGVAKAITAPLSDSKFVTRQKQLLGTPLYMSPEQAQLTDFSVDTRTDIYSLGVMLYEILTGAPPFAPARLRNADFEELRRIIREEEPPRPSSRISTMAADVTDTIFEDRRTDRRHLTQSLRHDLDWVVMKAIAKDRHRRYDTPSALADDIQRHLDKEPVVARPPSFAYQFGKFSRRHRGAFVTATLVVCSLLAGAITSAYFAYVADRQRARATAAMVAAREDRDTVQAKNTQQEILHEATELANARLRHSGWRDRARSRVADAETYHSDGASTLAFTRTLSGIDASEAYRSVQGAGRVAFDRAGQRLILALPEGRVNVVSPDDGDPPDAWTGNANSEARGVVGFDSFGQPTQARFTSPWSLSIARLGPGSFSKNLQIPSDLFPQQLVELWRQASPTTRALTLNQLDAEMRATGDLSRILTWHGLLKGPDDSVAASGFVCLWDMASAELIARVAAENGPLALSAGGEFFAVARPDGTVDVFDANSAQPRVSLQTGFREIVSVDLGVGIKDSADETSETVTDHLLAVADKWGKVCTWELNSLTPLNTMRATLHTLHAVRFSPDCSMLAVAGRGGIRLWDPFAGEPLLKLTETYDQKQVVWSPDGTHIAFSGNAVEVADDQHKAPGCYRIEPGPGIQQYRGLTSPAARVLFSFDGQRLAAVANDWTVGIWDVPTQRLIRKLRMPQAIFVDNCGMQFSPDGSAFYFAAKDTMTRWSVATGELMQRWSLPRGLQECIGTSPDGRVLLMRWEPDGKCRLRDMHSDDPVTLELPDAEESMSSVLGIRGTRDGAYFVIDGVVMRADQPDQAIRETFIVNGHTGEVLSRHATPNGNGGPTLPIADEKSLLFQQQDNKAAATTSQVIRLSDGKVFGGLPWNVQAISRDGRFTLETLPEHHSLFLRDVTNKRTLAHIALRTTPVSYAGVFSPDGNLAAWGNDNGNVSVCDLSRIREELELIGAAW